MRQTELTQIRFPAIADVRQLVHSLPIMKWFALIVGIAAVLMGLLWCAQGAGLIHWPASSFMIDERPWIIRGGLLTCVGLFLIAVSRLRK